MRLRHIRGPLARSRHQSFAYFVVGGFVRTHCQFCYVGLRHLVNDSGNDGSHRNTCWTYRLEVNQTWPDDGLIVQAIIFDIDGTLLRSSGDDDRLYRLAVQSVLGDVIFRDNLHQYEHVSDSGILTQIFQDNGVVPDDDRFNAVKSEFIRLTQIFIEEHGSFPEVPGAKSFLQRIDQSTDHRFAIATGGWRESARMKLFAANLPFENVPLATSDDAVGRTDIMLHALHSLGGAFDSITYYGDGEWDRAASEQLDWGFVGVGDAIGGISSFHSQPLNIGEA
jgi:beta-phosphoglucomutase-like phosphatase (HAD superfamily)